VIFTKNLAIDYGRAGIRANAICPGFIETPMLEGVFGMPGMETCASRSRDEHKLRRLGGPTRSPPRRVPRVGRRLVRHGPGDRGRRRLHGRAATTASPTCSGL
jgi:NAD(P)-dependent dehydrogenase (short-subunit alcohol dehydrogenase family)